MWSCIFQLPPQWRFSIYLLFFGCFLWISSTEACRFYNPGLPLNARNISVCPCGFAFVTSDGPNVCPTNFTAPACYRVNTTRYSTCSSHPRCCCTSGQCCDRWGRFRPSGAMCTASRGPCERDRFCTGTDSVCPTNYTSSSFVCKPKSGPCEGDWTCTGSNFRCPANYKAPSVLCAASRGPCEPDRYCSGISSICPARWNNGTICANTTGICQNPRVCVPGNPACPLNYKPNTTICQAARGGCERDSYCTGSSSVCPTASLFPSATVCGLSTGFCVSNGTCSGTGFSCPATTLSNGTVCRASTNPCETPIAYCNGTNSRCAFTFKPAGTACGVSTVCPRGQNRVCSGAGGVCLEPTQCSCMAGEYGRDCSCVSPGPGFGAVCSNATWFSVPNTEFVIPFNFTYDMSFFSTDDAYINGDMLINEQATLIMSMGSSLTVVGDFALDGALNLNASSVPNAASILTSGGQTIEWIGRFGNNPDAGSFDSVSVIGLPKVSCFLPVINRSYSNITRELRVSLSYRQDRQCRIPCPPPPPPGAECYGGTYFIPTTLNITEKVTISTSTQVEGSVIISSSNVTLTIGEQGSIAVSGCFSPGGTLNVVLNAESIQAALNASDVTTRVDFENGYCGGNVKEFSNVSVTIPSSVSCVSETHTTYYGESSISVVFSFSQIPNCPPGGPESGGLVLGAIIGIAAACVVAVGIMAASVYIKCIRKRVRPFERREND